MLGHGLAIPHPARSSTHTAATATAARLLLMSGERSDGRLLQDVDPAGGAEPDDVGHADLGALDLTVARLTAQLRGDLEHAGGAGHADRVTLREQPAGHVHRHRAVAPGGTRIDE